MIAKTNHHISLTSEEEKIAHGKKVLDRMGLTESVMEDAYRNGQTAVDVFRKTIAQKPNNSDSKRRHYEVEYDEKLEHARKVLDKAGLTEQALTEAHKRGETAAQLIHRKALENAEKNKAIKTEPKKPDPMLDAIFDDWLDSSDRLSEKDAEIQALREKIAALEARLAELEKPAAVA